MADRNDIIEALEALAIHCRPSLMGIDERAVWLRDWCNDLAGEDIEAIRVGCQRWRGGTNHKFPMVGQLMPLIRAATVKKGDGPLPQVWSPISDAEYNALSLNDKIRHHQIAASEAGYKAGPMWRDGRPLEISEMSAAWHHWRGVKANHLAEVKRLRGLISSRIEAAA